MPRLLIIFFIIFLSTCKDSPVNEHEVELPLPRIHSEIKLTHNSHFKNTPEINPYGFTFELYLKINLSKEYEINRISISDNDSISFEFDKEDLNDLWADSFEGLQFDGIILEEESFSSQKNFLITLYNGEDLVFDEFSVQLNQKVPHPAFSQNFWISDSDLEIEHSVHRQYYSSSSIEGFDLVQIFESAYTYWLDENLTIIDSTSITQNSVYQNDNDFFYTQNKVPSNAAFYFSSFSIEDSSITKTLTTQLQIINEKLPEKVSFFEIPGNEHNIIAVTEELLIGTRSNSSNQKLNTVFIVDKNTGALISEFNFHENLNQGFAPVLYNESENVIFYLNKETVLSKYDIASKTHETLIQLRKSWWDYNLFDFGDRIALTFGDYVSFYDINKDSLYNHEFMNYTNAFPHSSSNTSFYSIKHDALIFYLKDSHNEAFKITVNPDTHIFNPFEYLNLRSNSSITGYGYNENRKFHFNVNDSVLIHSTGAIIDLTKIDDFKNSKVEGSQFGAISSAWSEKDQTLFVVDGSKSVSIFNYSNNSLSQKQNLKTFFTITDSYFDEDEFKIIGQYPPSYNSPNRKVIIQSFSIDDIRK